MATLTINFSEKINSSLQIGDTAYSKALDAIEPTQLGTVVEIQRSAQVGNFYQDFNEIIISTTTSNVPAVTTVNADGEIIQGDYIFFSKNKHANTSGLVGYFADVKFENNSTNKAELFAIASEVSESSK
tara:strand:+ start:1601 stop:1987 length:387 start_codon:yes stop_codon:yes gene_type:complete